MLGPAAGCRAKIRIIPRRAVHHVFSIKPALLDHIPRQNPDDLAMFAICRHELTIGWIAFENGDFRVGRDEPVHLNLRVELVGPEKRHGHVGSILAHDVARHRHGLFNRIAAVFEAQARAESLMVPARDVPHGVNTFSR